MNSVIMFALIMILLFPTVSLSQVISPYEIRIYPDCVTTLDVAGFQNVLNPTVSPQNSYLFLVVATVMDDGEDDSWYASWLVGTADIGLHIYGGEHFETLLRTVRMYGPFDEGIDDDGSLKYEWDDNCSMRYNNFALLDVSSYPWRCVRILAIEGDDQEWIQGPDDVVYDAIVCLDQISAEAVQVPHTCDIPDQCARLWFAIRNCSDPDCGVFWR